MERQTEGEPGQGSSSYTHSGVVRGVRIRRREVARMHQVIDSESWRVVKIPAIVVGPSQRELRGSDAAKPTWKIGRAHV